MSIVGEDGSRISVARRPKRHAGGTVECAMTALRLIRYEQCVKLKEAGFRPSQIGPAVGYSKRHVNDVLSNMERLRGDLALLDAEDDDGED